ncbi:MAG TPA: NADH:ubiquinone reductase (Na(+)-transporting) subunit C [Cyclobacteriaceae bacterium]|nr:NADH:ubiquinone reductase (Na(+)-transporting) subunit C [Cytophagales bacterium]HMR57350.1 NADH:ubiquinone reductase (Na(+)-transporting) subunit C [Cyclobacteriaceae bacterium]HRE66671.1 NADH:ubiquinone reductase (Na(+)-transporting) subunit C [Cyclobacteriaceae bacterium]HRF35451.1 NADH:ubiquinone reductase (Na(+)-transporting) subunit C [Cyclobacteriaceae bacterium]
MRQSNLYIILYAMGLTVVCAGLLAFASQALKPRQDANVELERKTNVLSTVMTLGEGVDIEKTYSERIREIVIDAEGNVVEGKKPTDINLGVEYKKTPKDRLLPVFEVRSATDPNKIENAVLPVFGFGLWNTIAGNVALESDFNTIKGVNYSHVGETPGLGARIASADIQDRYKGKQIFEGDNLVSVDMQKGEGMDYASDVHKVDGMSGATLTAKGVNNMLREYFQCYEKYIKKNRTSNQQANL